MANAALSESPGQVRPQSTPPNSNSIELLPYVEVDGTRTLTDQSIKSIYEKMRLDRTLGIVFTQTIRSAEDFLFMMKRPNNIPVVLVVNEKIGGIAWLNSLEDNHAFAHFCFFKETWGKNTYEMGTKLLDYWFSFPGKDGPMFDVLIGRIPSSNKRAIRFVERLGFIKVGDIPLMDKNSSGDRVASTILYCRKDHGIERLRRL